MEVIRSIEMPAEEGTHAARRLVQWQGNKFWSQSLAP